MLVILYKLLVALVASAVMVAFAHSLERCRGLAEESGVRTIEQRSPGMRRLVLLAAYAVLLFVTVLMMAGWHRDTFVVACFLLPPPVIAIVVTAFPSPTVSRPTHNTFEYQRQYQRYLQEHVRWFCGREMFVTTVQMTAVFIAEALTLVIIPLHSELGGIVLDVDDFELFFEDCVGDLSVVIFGIPIVVPVLVYFLLKFLESE